MTRNGLLFRLALAAGLVLAVMLAGPHVAVAAAAAGGADAPRDVGGGVRELLAQRVLPAPYRLSVSVVGQTGPAAVLVVSGRGNQLVTVQNAQWNGGLRVVAQRAPLDERLVVVNDTGRPLQITLSRGRTVVFSDTLAPPDVSLSVQLAQLVQLEHPTAAP